MPIRKSRRIQGAIAALLQHRNIRTPSAARDLLIAEVKAHPDPETYALSLIEHKTKKAHAEFLAKHEENLQPFTYKRKPNHAEQEPQEARL